MSEACDPNQHLTEMNMSRSIAVGCGVAFLAMVVTATPAAAQDKRVEKLQWVPEMRAAINACMADQERLCFDIVPGNGRIVRCLAAQGDRLSVACATALQKASDALIAAGVTLNPGLISQ
jgi:hypothetical protein